MASNPYQFWLDALAGKNPPAVNEHPQPGFFRRKWRGTKKIARSDPPMYAGGFDPVAYWMEGDAIRCRVGSKDLSHNEAIELWTWVHDKPITEELYRAVAERGEPWPDVKPAEPEKEYARYGTLGEKGGIALDDRGIGDNSGDVDAATQLAEDIKTLAEGKKRHLKIASEDQSKDAQAFRSKLLELAGKAEKIHKAQKAPHLEKCREIDAKWLTLVKLARGAAEAVRVANDAWLTAKLQEAKAAAPEARAEDVLPETIKGVHGRAASVGTEWAIKEITDWDALLDHYKNSAAIREALEALAKRDTKDGKIVPGVVREEVARSR